VYRAEQRTLGRTVAVKVIHPHLLGDESAAARFIAEARAASRLNHPNSVGVIDFGKTDDGQLYLVMEFLRGRDLASVAYEDGPLPIRRILDVLRQTLAALAEAHHIGIIHRDLKPENIILEPLRSGGDFVKVVDFGLAKMVEGPRLTAITSPGIICGTPDYMSPEQGRGVVIDARSDLYAIGVILFQMLTSRLPFEADTATQVVLMHLSIPAPDPRQVSPERNIPEDLAAVVAKSLAKEPGDRWANADEMAEALARVQGELGGKIRVAQQTTCPSCGQPVPHGQKFCGECGARVSIPPLSRPPPPILEPRQAPSYIAAPTKLPLPLTHRQEDLSFLQMQRSELRSSLTAVRIVGEAGVGKTRLLREFLAAAKSSGDLVVETGPDPWWAEASYYAARRAIAALASISSSGGEERDWGGATAEARRGLIEVFGRADGVASTLSATERPYTRRRGVALGADARGRSRRTERRHSGRRRPESRGRREPLALSPMRSASPHWYRCSSSRRTCRRSTRAGATAPRVRSPAYRRAPQRSLRGRTGSVNAFLCGQGRRFPPRPRCCRSISTSSSASSAKGAAIRRGDWPT
jgi:serine/threonine-protein kinase